MKREIIPARTPIAGRVRVPGSKSETNRALVAAALAPGESTIVGASPARDARILAMALRRFGIRIEQTPEGLRVRGGALRPFTGELDFELAGTALRFALPLAAATAGARIVVTGNERMRARPIGDLVDALRGLGAEIEYLGAPGAPPLAVSGRALHTEGPIEISGATSSQFVSALLLAAPLVEGDVVLAPTGPVPSRPYVDMTIACQSAFGVDVAHDGERLAISAGAAYAPTRFVVDGDGSGASYFWGLAAITGGRVTVENLRPGGVQHDVAFTRVLASMGCEATWGAHGVSVAGPERLRAVDVDLGAMPDTVPTLAVVAGFADGCTRITGAGSLAHKESDRLRVIEEGLGRLGVRAEATAEEIRVWGGEARGATIDPHGDHRIAMAFALAGARVSRVRILRTGVVAKSMPSYWDLLASLGVRTVED